MLILGRKKGEEIVIGENIVVRIQDISSDSVKISIDAPREITVVRGELLLAAQENKMAASDENNLKDQMELLHNLICEK